MFDEDRPPHVEVLREHRVAEDIEKCGRGASPIGFAHHHSISYSCTISTSLESLEMKNLPRL